MEMISGVLGGSSMAAGAGGGSLLSEIGKASNAAMQSAMAGLPKPVQPTQAQTPKVDISQILAMLQEQSKKDLGT